MGQAMTNLIGQNRVAERRTNDQKPGESRRQWRDGKFVLTACRTENTFISHTKASHRASSIGVITVLPNTNHWNHLPNLLSGCLCILYNISTGLTCPWIIIFFSSSRSVITDWFVFLVISFGGEGNCPGRIKSIMAITAASQSSPSKSPVEVDDTKWVSISYSLRFLPQHLNLLFCANEWLPCIIDH